MQPHRDNGSRLPSARSVPTCAGSTALCWAPWSSSPSRRPRCRYLHVSETVTARRHHGRRRRTLAARQRRRGRCRLPPPHRLEWSPTRQPRHRRRRVQHRSRIAALSISHATHPYQYHALSARQRRVSAVPLPIAGVAAIVAWNCVISQETQWTRHPVPRVPVRSPGALLVNAVTGNRALTSRSTSGELLQLRSLGCAR